MKKIALALALVLSAGSFTVALAPLAQAKAYTWSHVAPNLGENPANGDRISPVN